MKTLGKIAIINGSMSKNSLTKTLLRKIESQLKKNGADTVFIDVQELNLPVYIPEMDPPAVLKKVSEQLIMAEGVVVGSPEYHGSYSGAIKNLLDFLGFKEFQDTPIALVTTTGGAKSGTNTMNHLRLVFRNLHGIVIPQQFAISNKETNPQLDLDESESIRLKKFIQGLETEVEKNIIYKKSKK